jgi:hypothetical protein
VARVGSGAQTVSGKRIGKGVDVVGLQEKYKTFSRKDGTSKISPHQQQTRLQENFRNRSPNRGTQTPTWPDKERKSYLLSDKHCIRILPG